MTDLSSLYGSSDERERRRLPLLIAVSAGLILLLSVLQVTVLERLFGSFAVPELMILLTLCYAFLRGRQAGAVVGIASGFVLEAMGGVGIAVLPLFYMLFGWFVGIYARTNLDKRFVSYLFYVLFALLVRAALSIFYVYLNFDAASLPTVLLHVVLPEVAMTAAAALVIFFPIKWLLGKV